MKQPSNFLTKPLFLAALFFIAASLTSPSDLHATPGGHGGGSGGSGGNDGSSSYGSPFGSGPSMPPLKGLEGMPEMQAPGTGNPFDDPSRRSAKKTPQQKQWEDKALEALGKYIKGKLEDYVKKKLEFPPILPPPLQAAKEMYDGITGAADTTKDVLDTVEAARKEFKAPYEKAAIGQFGSGYTGSSEDGYANAPGDINPDIPGNNIGGGGPQADHEDSMLW